MRKLHCGWQALLGMMSLVLVLSLALFVDTFSIVSHAESQGKVTTQSAKIRKEPSTSSSELGSAAQGDQISIIGQTTGSDGMIWYQIYVNANTKGYIRSDLAEVTDGSTPATLSANTTTTQNTTPAVNETPVDVTEVEPISANVTGGSAVRVRSNASTTSSIVTTAQNGLALTVTGTATGTDGNTWYRVNFIANGTQVVGFIRNDYVVLSGELVVPSDEPAPEVTVGPEVIIEDDNTKDWETQLDDDKWYLVDNAAGKRYVIQDMFNAVEANKNLYEDAQTKLKGQKVTVIVLVILLVISLGAIAMLIFRIKDMLDEAYFEEVEKETYKRRGIQGSSAPNRKIMQTVGEEQPIRQKAVSQAPQGARPAGQAPQGARPVQRPAGQVPTGAKPVQRPMGQAPAGAKPVQRPMGQAPTGAKPVQKSVGQAPQGARPVQQSGNATSNPAWKSKNFMADDDEFEFEFLNWEGDEE